MVNHSRLGHVPFSNYIRREFQPHSEESIVGPENVHKLFSKPWLGRRFGFESIVVRNINFIDKFTSSMNGSLGEGFNK